MSTKVKGKEPTVKELTIKELKTLIRETVQETLQDIFGDPDEGLELKEEVKAELRQSLAEFERGERGIPAEELAKELGLKL
ncbi:MAG: hypothetical protein HYX79_03075 [Chloroflexi bacterium]|nr:hypothetical protein [Chloroflexota bacterium]